ncbi:TetR/AcrR family transcriptional regulator [Agreia pratensis]|uniref:Transcriptional regulator, TetR family n=1 Tax=Agreia pratensis TaxID=150121 RepID=A0A1X7JEZ2_9MICO|nr:TetR/AcrR family transcriptional regulator [Agreia pratensis]MBF4635050.1 TetR/AcrR family transcriptional regulator [Agreia pratensis]SMG26283.1 transcriptional regulator, TetR family [Agreia pratensis]
MGRTRAFAEIDVVRAARGVFWSRGYEDTSLPDLEAATGLNRSSIYHSFGSKRGLFDAAIESYLDDVVRPRLEPLRADVVEPDALAVYLRGLRRAMVDEDTALAKNGCLLLNATGSSLGHEEGLAAVVTAYTSDLRGAVASGVAARHPELPRESLELLTTTCAGLVFASMAIVRVDHAAAAAMLDAALDALERRAF